MAGRRFQTRAEQVAERLREQLQAGVWSNALPGIRVLAAEHGVDPKTVTAALSILESEGRLARPRGTRPREILHLGSSSGGSTPLPSGSSRLLQLNSVEEGADIESQTMLAGTRDIWSIRMGEVVHRQIDFHRWKNPSHLLSSMLRRDRATALILFNAPQPWTSAALNLVPCYLSGGDVAADRDLSLFAFRQLAAFELLMSELHARGHERIFVPLHRSDRRLRKDLIAKWDTSWPKSGLKGLPSDYCVEVDGRRPDYWKPMWRREFARLEPTAVILGEPSHALSFYGFCHSAGLRIPADVSVIAMGSSPLFEWMEPVPHRTVFPVQKALRHFEKWLDGGLKPVGVELVELGVHAGASVTAPRR